MALTAGVGRYGHVRMAGKGIDPVTDSDMRPQRDNALRSGAHNSGGYSTAPRAYPPAERQQAPARVALLGRPRGAEENAEFTAHPEITAQAVRTALGEDTDTLLDEADRDVDELIRLINAETTMLPPVRLPGEADAEQESAHGLPDGEASSDDVAGALAADVKTWKKRFLKGAALSVLLTLTGGGAAALAMDKNVTVEVDGKERTVHSFGDTVGDVLDDAGIEIGKHDALSPSPQASVGDGAVIQLERGRQLDLVVDGVERAAWVRAATVGEALEQLGMSQLV